VRSSLAVREHAVRRTATDPHLPRARSCPAKPRLFLRRCRPTFCTSSALHRRCWMSSSKSCCGRARRSVRMAGAVGIARH
jgi:hypothetical protein